MLKRTAVLSIVIVASGCAADPVRVRTDQGAPQYLVFQRGEAIELDGRLNDPAWTRVDATAPFPLLSGERNGPITEARFAYDDQFLYVALRAERAGEVQPETGEVPDEIQLGIDADRSGSASWSTMLVPGAATRSDDAERALAVSEDAWTAELRVPWRAIGDAPRLPPAPGDRWFVSLTRRSVRAGGTAIASWAPPRHGGDADFGIIEFAARAAP